MRPSAADIVTDLSACTGINSYKQVGQKLCALTLDVLSACDPKPTYVEICLQVQICRENLLSNPIVNTLHHAPLKWHL